MFKMLRSLSYNTFAVFHVRSSIEVFKKDLQDLPSNMSDETLGKEIERETCETEWTSGQTSTFAKRVLDIIKYFVNPAMSTIGIAQNLMCIAILHKDGMRKTCNVLLMSVVVAGIFQQIMSLNVAEIIKHLKGSRMYSKYDKYVCFRKIDPVFEIFKMIFIFIGTWGQLVFSSTFMIITVNRLLVVYLPFKARFIVSKKLLYCSSILIYVSWLPWAVYKIFCFYIFDTVYVNIKFEYEHSDHRYRYLSVCFDKLTEEAIVTMALSKCVPLSTVLIGSLAIAVKIKFILAKRKDLTSRNPKLVWSNQTTKTLLTTCSVFSLTEVLLYIFSYIVSRGIKDTSVWLSIHFQLIYFAYLVTTSSTFFIFIFTNKKLLQHFIDITKLFRFK
nr:putative G-protein coupled receptor [Biomphalaria glabrata]